MALITAAIAVGALACIAVFYIIFKTMWDRHKRRLKGKRAKVWNSERKVKVTDNDNIPVNVHTLARNLDPNNDSVQWPLPFEIKLTDTPATICARFKKTYGYALDTLMLEPETWKNGDDPDKPKLFKRSGCSLFFCGRHKQEFVLRHKDWTIEVRV